MGVTAVEVAEDEAWLFWGWMVRDIARLKTGEGLQIPPRMRGMNPHARSQTKYTRCARVAKANKARKRYAATLLGRYSQKTTTMVPLTTGPKGGPSLSVIELGRVGKDQRCQVWE